MSRLSPSPKPEGRDRKETLQNQPPAHFQLRVLYLRSKVMTRLRWQELRTIPDRWLVLAVALCLVLVAPPASAQLAANQTNGFGNNRLTTFSYLQNFNCVDQPLLDLD